MKNVIFVAVVLSVVLGVSGCSKSDSGEESGSSSSVVSSSESTSSSQSSSSNTSSNNSTSSSTTSSVTDSNSSQSSISSSSSDNNSSADDTSSSTSSSEDLSVSSSSTESSSSTTEQLLSLNLTTPNTELEEGKEITLTLSGDYSRGASKPITSNITWIINNTSVLNIHNTTLRALKEGATTIRAKVDGRLSQKLTITVYKVIEGHRLPPEPDEKLNNSTLLGIDVNGNGVRDDVERWIYTRYHMHFPCKRVPKTVVHYKTGEKMHGHKKVCEDKKVPYHPIVREVVMQGARAMQIVIQEPERAVETRPIVSAAVECSMYFELGAKHNNEPILLDRNLIGGHVFGDEFKAAQFNTTKRVRAYARYNMALSGGIFGSASNDQGRDLCDFNITKLIQENR